MVQPPGPADDVPKREIRKEQYMASELLERRGLELVIRRAEAEQHLLARRLDQLALDHWRARRSIEVRLREQPWSRLAG
jgi:hypothetical protein